MTRNPPNLLLVTVDCLRYDHAGTDPERAGSTPNLTRLASHATVFDRAVSQGPGTTFAFPAILGSAYSFGFDSACTMHAPPDLISEQLQRAGYTTAAFVSNPYLGASAGYHRGFETFDECYTPNQIAQRLRGGLNKLLDPLNLSIECPSYPSARDVNRRVVEWLAGSPRQPFFLWVHYMDCHWPYALDRCILAGLGSLQAQVNSRRFARRLRSNPGSVTRQALAALKTRYGQGVEAVDRALGELLAALDLAHSNTSVALTADHGEAFGEHGSYFHTRLLYDELVHIPLVVRFPENLSAPRRVARQVRHIDLAPTLLDLAGAPRQEAYRGVSLLSLLDAPSGPDLPGVSQVLRPDSWSVALRQGEWKEILHLDPHSLNTLRGELYHLVSDPEEKLDRFYTDPLVAQKLHDEIVEIARAIQEQAAETPLDSVQADGEVLDRLRGLGYVD